MSFIEEQKGQVYAPGWFLVDQENVTRVTAEMDPSMAETAEDGSKYVPMGKIWPTNDQNAVGIVYETVDVTSGNMPGSLVTSGVVDKYRLFDELTEDSEKTLEARGIVFTMFPDDGNQVKRPY